MCNLGNFWMQGCHITADDGSALRGMANHLETFDNKQFMGADTQYFQTAQMKLHAREERLQVSYLALANDSQPYSM